MNDIVEGLPSGAWSLLGLELWGSRPLGHVRLPLVPDRISVLYGLNGAGKSTVLNAVRSALRGTCDESPFLKRFRIHAELQDPDRDDPLSAMIRRLLTRRYVSGNPLFSTDPSLPAWTLGGSLPTGPEALRLHLQRLLQDPCCTAGIATGLAADTEGGCALRITMTVQGRGQMTLALAVKPDGNSNSLMSRLLAQLADADPDDPVVVGSPLGVVWNAIERRLAPASDHDCVFFPGHANVHALSLSEWPAQAVRRGIAERWASDWLFAGELDDAVACHRSMERWQSVPVATIGSEAAPRNLFRFGVASDQDDLLAPATRIVTSVQALHLTEESELRARDLAQREEKQRRWVMEQTDRALADQIASDPSLLPDPGFPAHPFPHSSIEDSPIAASREGDLGHGTWRPVHSTVRDSLQAANAAIRDWGSAFVALPQAVIRTGPIRDRHSQLRGPNQLMGATEDSIEIAQSRLSTAQARWISIAISFLSRREWLPGPREGSAHPSNSPHVVLFLDEPERSLHRGAERDVLRRLERLVGEENATAFIATHSPVILDSDAVVMHHVRMVEGRIGVRSNNQGENDLDEISRRIGARRSDVAVLHRAFVLVEGEADRAVLEGLFGDQLSSLRTSIVTMTGTDALHTAVTPHGLLGLTDASVVILLDHVDHARMVGVRQQLERRIARDGPERASAWLNNQRFDRTAERAAAGLFENAVRHGDLSRIEVVGISAVDILELIPFELLGCQRPREEFDAVVAAEAAAGRRWTSMRTKQWLKDGGADVSVDGVRDAVSRMDTVPPELLKLLEVVRVSAERARSIAGGAPIVADEA